MAREVQLSFSDTEFGCAEFGFIDRPKQLGDDDDSCEAEDRLYRRHLRANGRDFRVRDGKIFVP